jgi:hypothetical protein
VNTNVLVAASHGKVVELGPILDKNVNGVRTTSNHTIWKNSSNIFVRIVNVYGTGNLWQKVSDVRTAIRQH